MTRMGRGMFVLASFWWASDLYGQDFTEQDGPDWHCSPLLWISTNTEDNAVRVQTNTVIELRGGLNRLQDGKWIKSDPKLRLGEDGSATGLGARHSIHLAQNINSAGAIQVSFPSTSGPELLRMHLLGLFYEDAGLGTNILIADIKDSPAHIVGEHVRYDDAFVGVLGDVTYAYTVSGLSQQILLRSPLPDPAAYGLSPSSAVLVAITEIIDGPEPQTEARSSSDGQAGSSDYTLDFGNMSMVQGWAFRLSSAPERLSSLPVSKEYRTTAAGRRVILERVRFSPVQEQLLALPLSSQNTNGTAGLRTSAPVLAQGALPVRPQKPTTASQRLAATDSSSGDGMVLDWDLVHTALKDVTFRRAPGFTYLITGETHLGGSTTINPGAVLRFEAGPLFVDGTMNVGNAPDGVLKPVITSAFDETVGPGLRSGQAAVGQSVPALIVRNADYSNAVRMIESRHPGARLVPQFTAGMPRVQVRKIRETGVDGSVHSGLSVLRSGGGQDQPLILTLTAELCSKAGVVLRRNNLAATIPANSDSVEVPVADFVSSAPTNSTVLTLTVEPDPTGAYVPDDQLDSALSLPGSGGISPMMLQAPGNMLGWWKGDGNATDSWGGHNGTMMNGANWVDGWVNQAFSFDGVDDYMQVADTLGALALNPVTLEFWVKRQRQTGAYEYLIEKGGDWMGGAQSYALQIHGADNDLCFTWNNGYRMAGIINDLDWHHCAVTAANGQTDPVLYIDGWPQPITLRYGGSVNMNTSSSGPLHVGAQYDTSWKYYGNTLIDELSIYSRGLSQSEVQSIFNSGRAGKATGPYTCACPSGVVSWWRGENDASDSYGGNHGSFYGTYMGGEVGQTFRIVDSSSIVTIPQSPSLNAGTGGGFTIEGWMNVYDDDTGGHPLFEWAGAGYGVHVWVNYQAVGSLWVNIYDTSGTSHIIWAAAGIQSKCFQHVAVSYDRSTGNCQVFVNGNSVALQALGTFTPQTSYPLYLGFRPANLGGGPRAFNGVIDEVSLYNRALSLGDIQAIYGAQSAGKCPGNQATPPSITTQPQSQSITGGGSASFSVTAAGSAPLTYQWFRAGAAILGATSATLSLSTVHLPDAGDYKVIVSNPAGSAISSLATLTVLEVATPVFSPVGGSYPPPSKSITVTCATAGATIHYTLNGAVPTESDPVIATGSTVLVDHNLTLQSKAWKTGWAASDTETAGYRIEASPSDLPPIISISPASATSILASDDIPLLVTATDQDGISKIQLFLNGIKAAETTQSPLQYTLGCVSSGTYTFTARAIDNAGFATWASPAVFTVVASGPVVSLQGQSPFFTSSPGTLLASVLGVNPGAMATLTLNGAAQPLATGAFSLRPALAEGDNTFTLVATDNQSRNGQATAKVSLDSLSPTVTFSSPANNCSFATTRTDISGSFSEASVRSITVNGVSAFINGNSWTALNVPLALGANTITATAQDIAGNTGQATMTINGAANPADPVQLSAAPIGGFAPLQVLFTSQASTLPGTIQQVQYDFDGDGVFDQTTSALGQLWHTYNSPGEFFPVVSVVTTAGRFSSTGGWGGGSQRIRIGVQSAPALVRTITVADPVDLKCTSDGNVYVLSRATQTIAEYDGSGTLVRSLASIGQNPNGIEVDAAGNVYVAITDENQVRKFNAMGNSFQPDTAFNGGRIGRADKTPGTANGEFSAPFDVAINADEEIAVSDSANHRIQRFTKLGVFLEAYGSPGSGPGQFNIPKGLCYDETDTLYIVDSGNNRVVLANSAGYCGASGVFGQAFGQFEGPVNLSAGASGIYVADTGNNRVELFGALPAGDSETFLPLVARCTLSTEQSLNQPLNHPASVATAKDYLQEKFYVADTGNNRVVLVSMPRDNPESTWSAMRQQLVAGNISAAIPYFSSLSAEKYRSSFLAIGATDLASIMSQVGSISPVSVEAHNAQYRFDQIVQGVTLTFPIEFVKENGVWKILEY